MPATALELAGVLNVIQLDVSAIKTGQKIGAVQIFMRKVTDIHI